MLKDNIDALVSKLEHLVSTKTVIGEPITVGNNTLVPVISASFGLGQQVAKVMNQAKAGAKAGVQVPEPGLPPLSSPWKEKISASIP